MKPPPRLLDDPTLAAELRTDLERSAATKPAYDVSAGLVGLQAAIIASAAASASAPSTAAAAHAGSAGTTAAAKAASTGLWSAFGAKVIGLSVVGTVVATAVTWPLMSREPKAAPRASAHAPATSTSHAPTSVAPQASAPALAPSAPPPDTAPAADSADVLVRLPEPVPARVPFPSASPSSSSGGTAPALRGGASSGGTAPALRGGASSLRREIDQLARIKSLVDSEPALAYRLARQGDRDFAHGVLRQEREALAIVALANSDRRPEAAGQLRAFVARYPHSPARERLEQMLGTAGQ